MRKNEETIKRRRADVKKFIEENCNKRNVYELLEEFAHKHYLNWQTIAKDYYYKEKD